MISSGLRIGRYEIGRRLGKGGFGVVHIARDVDLDREIAIKVLKPEYLARPQIVQRFIKEARAAAKIGHPGIVTIFECGQIQGTGTVDDGNAYIAMELLVGRSLSDRLLENGRMSTAQAITIARQLAAALGAAHASGIVHRDLKPDNVYLVPDAAVHGGERVKILDFGVAKLMEGSTDDGIVTHSQMMLGTPKYMAPEQARSATKVDHRADIYSLGCMLFEMLVGRAPFQGNDAGEVLLAHQKTPPPSVRGLNYTVPSSIDVLIRRMMAKDPDSRPQSMTEVGDVLVELTDEPDTVVRKPIAAIAPRVSAEITTVQENVAPRPWREQRTLLIAVGLGALVLSGAGAFILLRGDTAPKVAETKVVETEPTPLPVEEPATFDAPAIDVVDAAPYADDDPVERLRFQCLHAADQRKWSDLITCASELKKVDRTRGEALYRAGHDEEKAEVVNRAFESALQDNNLKLAQIKLGEIPNTSVYKKEAEEKLAAAQAAAKANKPDKPDKPDKCSDVEELVEKGRSFIVNESPGAAVPLLEAAYRCRQDAGTMRLLILAVYKARNLAKAKALANTLPRAMKDLLYSTCANNGLQL